MDYVRLRIESWLALVDRVPPADLIERVLRDTAYAYEIRGPRRHQAWENLKKMRGLVRRIQNRGYATLKRLADHIDALTPGDESNAVIEALDAVNLMTVHAAKGLEFPVVFVVNLARGATGPPDPVRIVADGEEDAPSVSIGPFVSESDEAERDREKQETRRLLYVAMTRARDRLYLSSSLKDGVLVPGRGGLAEVLPDSIRDLFNRAGREDSGSELNWIGRSGRSYQWRVCRTSEPPSRELAAIAPGTGRRVRLEARTEEPATRCSVSEWIDETPTSPDVQGGRNRHLTAGILVHRLFQASRPIADADSTAELAFAAALIRPDEWAGITDRDQVVGEALRAWRSLSLRQDVVDLLSGGRVMHEVPFSMAGRRSGSTVILRGIIDCVVQKDDGSIVIVEFKTGRPDPRHQRQLAAYVEAAKAIYPEASITGRLLYAD